MKYFVTILCFCVLMVLSLSGVKGEEADAAAGHVKTKDGTFL